MRLAEMCEDRLAAATCGLANAEKRVELGAFDALDLVGGIAAVDHPTALDDIGHAIGHPDLGGQAIATGAAGLLIIGLDGARKIEMGDISHIRLVDPHAEGNGCDEAQFLLFQKGILMPVAHIPLETGVIRQRMNALPVQPIGRLLDLGA